MTSPTRVSPPDSEIPALDANARLIDAIIRGRFSCRFYQDKAVPKKVIEELIEVGRFSPSGNNTQSWGKVYCIMGERLKAIRQDMVAAVVQDDAHKPQYNYYPSWTFLPDVYVKRRQESRRSISTVLGVEGDNREPGTRSAGRNHLFFGAPAVLVFTISSRLEKGSWIDLGHFMQTIIIVARARGLETCSQVRIYICQYHRVLRKHVAIPEDDIVVIVMSVGYPDLELTERFPVKLPRREVGDILEFHL
ncbi:nitroreductase [Coprinopsis cinerea okayama7|uniref:Nitroreductase n=1 Tax=Coprinopsis cinerea (strain Okayama-7 / 130 / ATCC MYA-4618 / FGSC 9003) TaxID=240176 RepID=D6RNR4_COPC7|nr:nitroreductase [Coprinopsis cinerea okayama7\|eukprot:XP_002910876.1 nitroreductase [Coprinopsis cinerea okayama7\